MYIVPWETYLDPGNTEIFVGRDEGLSGSFCTSSQPFQPVQTAGVGRLSYYMILKDLAKDFLRIILYQNERLQTDGVDFLSYPGYPGYHMILTNSAIHLCFFGIVLEMQFRIGHAIHLSSISQVVGSISSLGPTRKWTITEGGENPAIMVSEN